jgi:hypothetical protein
MSLAATLPAAILDTVLGRLALLFLIGAAGDLVAARHAAHQMLAAYHPETPDELRLAAEIVGFSFQALEALSQAATPDMALTKILRLRGGAVSLSRESHKAQRKLDQLQRARRVGITAQPAETLVETPDTQPPAAQPKSTRPELTPTRPQIDQALALIEATRQTMAAAGKNGGKTWTQAYQQRLTAARIANNLNKNKAIHAATLTAAAASTASAAQTA